MSDLERLVFADPAVADRYAPVRCIGGGASSSVYEAVQRSTGQRVAIKVLRPPGERRPGSSVSDAERFRRETHLCAQLHHPNIVRLIDSGEIEALLYAVFELVPGHTLAEALTRHGPLPPAEALHLMMQVLDALSCSHGLGIAHRDLKPANIMVTSTGARRNAMVLDFGLGVLAEDTSHAVGTRLTADGEYLGTPLYSAPEQLCGKPPTVLSDVYAWGLIFIECLTGTAAVAGRTIAEVVHDQLSLQPIPVPRALATHPLGRLLRSATVKEPAEARATAHDLLRELQAIAPTSLPGSDELCRDRRDVAVRSAAGVPSGAADVLWRVPLPRNRNFTGRRQALSAVRDALTTDPPPAVVALTGLGGIGKTQIALEYAHRFAREYEVVAWLRAEEADALAADYAGLAELLGLPEKQTPDQFRRIEAVRRWLERRPHWLLVFDNVPTAEAIRPYLPHWPIGHVIATSRHQAWRSVGASIPIDVLEPAEAAEFLVARTGAETSSDARELCADLGCLPLALEEAAAYIEATGRSIATYRRLLESNRLRVFEEGSPPANYPWTVRSTWELSLKRLEVESPPAAQLLCLCAYLAPDDIPLADLRDGLVQLGQDGLAPLGDELELDRGLAALRRYSLVKLGDGALSLHRLVQLVTRDRLEPDARARWADLALRVVEAMYPRSGLAGDVRPEAGRLLPHSLAALGHVEALPQCEERAAQLLIRTGIYMSATGVQARAIEHLTKALQIFDRHPEFGDGERAAVLANVAVVQNARGEIAEARDLFERALALHERISGPESATVALDLVNLAWIRRVLGDRLEARAAGERAARILSGTLGAWHPIVATVQSVTARVLWELGDLDAARRVVAEVFHILDRARSKFHPMMAGAWFQSGLLALALGDLDRAASCARHGADVGTPAYGPDHPLVLSNLMVNGQVLLEREDHDGARRIFERIVNGSQRTCARPHADIALALPLLAQTQLRGGDPTLARRTVEQALGASAAVAGDRTALLARIHVAAGDLAASENDLAAALGEHASACALLATRCGDAHPVLLPALTALAATHLRRGEAAEARSCSERALAIGSAARLERHLDVAAALEQLASALAGQGARGPAGECLGEAQAIVRDRLGAQSARARRLDRRIREVLDD